MAGSSPRWTDADQSTLEAQAAACWSASEIGKLLGKTRNAVIGRAHRQGVQLQGRSYAATTRR